MPTLNLADAIHLGSQQVDKVYLGANQVWSSALDFGAFKQFWRVRVTAVDGGSNIAIAELGMWGGRPATNLCTGGEGFASAVGADSSPASVAFDGSSALSWRAPISTPQWIGYKFAGSVVAPGSVRITASDIPSESPKDFVIEYWDGAAFQTWRTVTGATGWIAGETRSYTPA